MGTALVTGATSGIGQEFCWQLAAAGWDVVLVARRRSALEREAGRIRAVAGVGAEALAADLATGAGVDAVAARLEDRRAPVDLLVNDAGFGLGAPFLDDSLEDERRALDVMVGAVMSLSWHAARAMRGRGRGAIVNVSSVAALSGGGTYGAHKAWVLAFSDALGQELRGSGVTVTCVLPGLTRTDFHRRARLDVARLPGWWWASPERVAAQALAAARRGRAHVTPTALYATAGFLARHAPRPAVHAVLRLARPERAGGGRYLGRDGRSRR